MICTEDYREAVKAREEKRTPVFGAGSFCTASRASPDDALMALARLAEYTPSF